MAMPDSLQKFMIVASTSNASTYHILARDDELYLLKEENRVLTQCNLSGTDTTINEAYCKMPERWEEKEDRNDAVEISDENSKTHGQEEGVIPEEYSSYRKNVLNGETVWGCIDCPSQLG